MNMFWNPQLVRYLLGFSPLKICRRPSQFWSSFYGWWGLYWIEWKKLIKNILRFLFFELSWKIHRKLGQKMTITRKIKICNLIIFSIQPIPDLSCRFELFREKKLDFFFKYVRKKNWGASPSIKKLPGSRIFFYDWWTLVGTGWHQRHTR